MTTPLQDSSCGISPTAGGILHQEGDITIIDIPHSISAAQGIPQSPSHRLILSCEPIKSCFASNEPKSNVAKARLTAKMATENDELYAQTIAQALHSIKDAYLGEWCLPRHCDPTNFKSGNKRKAGASSEDELLPHSKPAAKHGQSGGPPETPNSDHNYSTSTANMLQTLALEHSSDHQNFTLRWRDCNSEHPGNDSSKLLSATTTTSESWEHTINNPAEQCRTLDISDDNLQPMTFHIPPSTAAYLGDCTNPRPFHSAVREHAHPGKAQFDLILMDPPWPNASVSRARTSGYQTASTVWDIRQLLFDMEIDVLLARGGLIGVWITNNLAVRRLVLGEDGLFESWGVTLQEEWLYVKTTVSGKPVSPLDSLWRKPYEVLLLGRKNHIDTVGEAHDIKRRVIAAVPDLHSRKPCLKSLLEAYMPDPTKYRALEVFARYLVAGWWSWGNEVIKFNHERCWK